MKTVVSTYKYHDAVVQYVTVFRLILAKRVKH